MDNLDFIRTDELNEAIRDLNLVDNFLDKVLENIHYWKWVIISLHMSMQGFMVSALRGSNGLNVLRDKVAEKWLQAYHSGGKYPEEYLDTFLNLYKKLKSDRMLMYIHSKKFEATKEQDWAVKKLNSIRNQYIHFGPATYLLEKSGLPNIIMACIDVINFIIFESNNIDLEEKLICKTREIIDSIKDKINKINSQKYIYINLYD